MKQLTCEMCGSTDLLKQEGVFVCQTCGTKYSVEEAKKMMIEGTVDVSGTVKVDKSGELDNLLILAERALKEGNYESAESYYDNVLRIEPDNWRANFYRSYCSTMHSKIINLFGNYTTTVNTAISTEKMLLQRESVDFKACGDIVLSISELTRVCFVNKYNIYNQNPEHNEVLYGGSVVTHNQGGYQKLQQECAKIVDTAIAFYFFCYSVKKANGNFLTATEKALTRLKDNYDSIPTAPYAGVLLYKKYHNSLCEVNLNVKKVIEKHIKEVRDKLSTVAAEEARIAREKAAKAAEEQRIKNESYWIEHAEEKQHLESELNSLQVELKQLQAQVSPFDTEIKSIKDKRDGAVPSEQKKETVMNEISRLRTEQGNLGLFKGKQKKELQAQIDELSSRLSTINDSIEAERREQQKNCNAKIKEVEERAKPIKDKITDTQKRISEINTELTKNR